MTAVAETARHLRIVTNAINEGVIRVDRHRRGPPKGFLMLHCRRTDLRITDHASSLRGLLQQFPETRTKSTARLAAPIRLNLGIADSHPPIKQV